MRKITWLSTLLLTATIATPALAGAGLPTLARISTGDYQVLLQGDSPTLHTGTNTITVAVADLPDEVPITIQFVGPQGQSIALPLQPLTVLEGPADAHGGDHGTAADDHGDEAHGETHGDDAHATPSFQARGKITLPETGPWRAVIQVGDQTETFPFDVVYGGPNRLFVGASGSTMAGALLYGAITCRRKEA